MGNCDKSQTSPERDSSAQPQHLWQDKPTVGSVSAAFDIGGSVKGSAQASSSDVEILSA